METKPKRRASRITGTFCALIATASLGLSPGHADGPLWPWTVDGVDAFGESAASAGDVNGDGYDDVIVGDWRLAPGNDVGLGAAYVYHGSPSGPSSTADWTATGVVDRSQFGGSVAGAGDVDGDGYDDVVVGARGEFSSSGVPGAAYLFLGSENGLSESPATTLSDSLGGTRFGDSVAPAGDVNGDGYDDVIVGAPRYDGTVTRGAAFLYFGSASGLSALPAWSAEGDLDQAYFGSDVAGVGDVNGDGFDDIIVANGDSDTFAHVYYGSSQGPSIEPDWTTALTLSAEISVGTAGDVNGDGYDDALMGNHRYNHTGIAIVFHGSPLGLSASFDWRVSGEFGNSFARAVSTLGDVNGDGYDDVVVGDPRTTLTGPGYAFLYLGSPSGLSVVADWTGRGNNGTDDGFGRVVRAAGDVNGDGSPELLIAEASAYHYVSLFFGPELCTLTDRDADGVLRCAGDCDDSLPHCTFDCTDGDGDEACPPFDCDDGDPLCGVDCTDADSDGYCVTTDCDDTQPGCTTDCTGDADGDLVPVCADCDDSMGFCRLECANQDGDDRCVDFDCDDTNPNCGYDCTDSDGDGWCNAFDCAVANPHCTSDCTDADEDGFCITTDCDEANALCTEDCTDADDDGWCVTFDCDDAVASCDEDCSDADSDGVGACYGDCDDMDPSARPGLVEHCTDDVDNDCNGFKDDEDAACSDLLAVALNFGTGSPSTLSWTAAPGANSHSLYRGRLSAIGFTAYNHLCEAAEIEGTTAVDPDVPLLGEAFYYLVAGQTLRVGPPEEYKAGPLGRASNGASRPDSSTITCGERVYVDPDVAVGTHDGLSWATAYTSVSAALAEAGFTERGLEVWARGEWSGAATLDVADRPGVRLLGGFAGTEAASWERDPVLTPSVWDVNGQSWALRTVGASAVLDGITLRNGGVGLLGLPGGAWIELTEVRVEQMSGYGADLVFESSARLWIHGNGFVDSGAGGMRAVAEAGLLSGDIRRNSFAGGGTEVVVLEARPTSSDAEVRLDVVGNTISGGDAGLVLGAHVAFEALDARQLSFVASNLIHGTTGTPLRIEAAGQYSAGTGPSAITASPIVVGNTLSDGGGAGIACRATRIGSAEDHTVHAVPALWDNLVTFNAGPGIEESGDDPGTDLISDPLVVGNDLFGNALLYLDEGVSALTSIEEVNALSGAYDNFVDDPLYVDRPSDDYHLSGGQNQTAIDSGHAEAPRSAKQDLDGEARSRDGDGDGEARADTGADER